MAQSANNKPCPCNSGKLYGECCGVNETSISSGWIPKVINGGLSEGEQSLSIDHMNAALTRAMKAENECPRDDFCGLSSKDMSDFLYQPFDSPGIVEFNKNMDKIPDSPFTKLFIKLLDECGEKGLKLTAKGNLSRNFCRDTAREYFSRDLFDDKTLFRLITTELNFDELHTVHIISKLSGYTKKYRGRLRLTKRGEKLLHSGITGDVFLHIFKKYTLDFNWAYRDYCEELRIIQTSFLFTLFLLKRFGDIYRVPSFYNKLFIKAFPTARYDVPERTYSSPEKIVGHAYSLRAIEGFAHFFGFALFNILEERYFSRKYELKKTPFLNMFITFHK